MPVSIVIATLVVIAVGLLPASAVATPTNENPLADAGLDRDITANATVYLDAAGSRDPDGTIESYEWSIERPDGNNTKPECATCGRTSFVPHEAGTYNATVTVTDDDGATNTDTLRVQVEPTDGPSLTVSGPSSVTTGAVAGFSASVSAGSANLSAVTWRLDGRRLNRTTITGDNAAEDHEHVFVDSGNYTLTAVVVDRLGRERSRNKSITVVEPTPTISGGESGDETGSNSDSSDDCYYPEDSVFSCEADSVTSNNGTTVTISDTDRDGNVTVNGTTFKVRTGDTVTINQSTWQDHYQPNLNADPNDGALFGKIHYEPGIQQGPNDTNGEYVSNWVVNTDFDRSPEETEDDDAGGSWTGRREQTVSDSGTDSSLPETVPSSVRNNIIRVKDTTTN